MKGKAFQLPDEVCRLILEHGCTIRGMTPEDLLACTRFYEMDRLQEEIYDTLYSGSIYGACTSKDIIEIDGDRLPEIRNNPKKWAPRIWHELVHNAQRHEEGDAKFNISYLSQWVFKAGWIGKRWKRVISYEREAYAEQTAFSMRMGG